MPVVSHRMKHFSGSNFKRQRCDLKTNISRCIRCRGETTGGQRSAGKLQEASAIHGTISFVPQGSHTVGTARAMMCPVKPAAENAFHNQMIGAGCRADADAEVDFPFGRYVQIDGREKLLLLVVQ